MKYIILFLFLSSACIAQEKSLSFKVRGDNNVLEISPKQASDVFIEGYDGNKVIVILDDDCGDCPDEPKKSGKMKLIGAGGVDNTGLGINMESKKQKMKLSVLKSNVDEIRLKVPNDILVKIAASPFVSDIDFKDFQGEVELTSVVADVNFENCMGPLVVSTASGDITASFDKINPESPTSLVSAAGDIDVTLNESMNLNVEIISVVGEAFTDLDLKMEEGNDNSFGTSVNAKLNQGGVSLKLKTASGDVYLRAAGNK